MIKLKDLLNEKVDSKKLKNDPFHKWVTGSGKLSKFKDEIHDILDDIVGMDYDTISVTKKFIEDVESVEAYDYFKDPEMKAEALKQLKSSYPKAKKYLSNVLKKKVDKLSKKIIKLDALVKKLK